MKKLSMIAIAALAFLGLTGTAYAFMGASTASLAVDDYVGISFWLVTMGMLAGAVFFFIERGTVAASWRTSVTVAGLIQFVAFVHYVYMRDIWVATGDSPTVYRYIDWLITVPLQIVEFYLILAAVKKVPTSLFWKLLVASLVMLIGGYLGETGAIQPFVGFIIGMAGWIYILFEIFSGEVFSFSIIVLKVSSSTLDGLIFINILFLLSISFLTLLFEASINSTILFIYLVYFYY